MTKDEICSIRKVQQANREVWDQGVGQAPGPRPQATLSLLRCWRISTCQGWYVIYYYYYDHYYILLYIIMFRIIFRFFFFLFSISFSFFFYFLLLFLSCSFFLVLSFLFFLLFLVSNCFSGADRPKSYDIADDNSRKTTIARKNVKPYFKKLKEERKRKKLLASLRDSP